MKMRMRVKGGPGSGFTTEAGHCGIEGQQGGSRRCSTPATSKGTYSISTAQGRVDVMYDTQNVADTDAKQVAEWAGNIPADVWQRSQLRSVRLFEDPSDTDAYIADHYPNEYAMGVGAYATANGMYDYGLRQALISRWSDLDMSGAGDGNSGRTFYHEFAHSTDLSTDDAWFAVADEWRDGSDNNEAFSTAFADYMVAKYYYESLPDKGAWGGDESYLQEFKRLHPKITELFEGWGL